MIQALPAFNVSCPSCRSEFPVDPEKVPARGIHAICSTCLRVFRVERPEGYAEVELSESLSATTEESPVAFGAATVEVDFESVSDAVPEGLEAFQDLGGFDEADTDELEFGEITGVVDEVEVLDEVGAEYEVEISDELEIAEDVVEVEVVEEVDIVEEVEVAPPEPERVAPPPPPRPQAIEDLTSLAQEAIAEGAGEVGKAQLAGSSLSLGADRFRKRGPQERAQRLARVLVSDIIAYYPARYRESVQRGTLKEDFQDEVRKSWKEYVDQVGQELAESTPYFGEALNEILGQGKQIF